MDLVSQIQIFTASLSKLLVHTTTTLQRDCGQISADELRVRLNSIDPNNSSSSPTGGDGDEKKMFPFEAVIQSRANEIFSLAVQIDVLMASLPVHFASKDEQLAQIDQLERENQEALSRLCEAKALAEETRVDASHMLGAISNVHYKSQELLTIPSYSQ